MRAAQKKKSDLEKHSIEQQQQKKRLIHQLDTQKPLQD